VSEESLIVVNKKDEVVASLARSLCHQAPYPIHREIFVLLYSPEGGVWMQKRSRRKQQYPGYWTVTASGHVEKGESYVQAARRELEEELGVRTELTRGMKWLHEREDNRAIIQVFTGEYDGKFALDLGEVAEIRKFKRGEIEQVKEKLTKAARECLMMLKLLEEKS